MIFRPLSPVLLIIFIVGLTACVDRSKTSSISQPGTAITVNDATPRFASGPIATACLIHDRRQASAERCGCIQAAADLTLSQAQQQRSVRFFSEPDLLQEIRQSDTPSNQRFWDSWQLFAETAQSLCSS